MPNLTLEHVAERLLRDVQEALGNWNRHLFVKDRETLAITLIMAALAAQHKRPLKQTQRGRRYVGG